MSLTTSLQSIPNQVPEAAREATFHLFLGIGAVLLIASLIGWLLRWKLGRDNGVVANLVARTNAWWVMVAVIGIALLGGHTGVVLLFGLISFFALREFITLTNTRRGDHYALLACFFVFLPLQYVFVWQNWYGMFSILIPVYAFLLMPCLACLGQDTTNFLARATQTQWGLMICVYAISHVPALLALNIAGYEERNLLLVVFLIIVVQSSDVLQYVWGKLFGRRKIAPNLSPSKTVAGFLGGLGSATALGAALFWITPFTPWQAAGMALAITLMGFFGGLVMSAIKRDRGVKDWGHMIEGHGGMLDRLDSVCFSAPVFFHLVRYFFT
ncbi:MULTISPECIES: phosphatidate cytidylyltransferase [unclassified Uliginosibacterium]|jgi:phosphatidate cytidylyltransferase|uniref:phosphatidate cytidylyltransferase n=1 Tax=unclassified Uliginosibacterium TaxID=2621521 RepID=UPI000C7D8056|nr:MULTISPECIES: phosphatidate cytidylyltransferase [unclassified Uliginosibacterium]MDO6386883.1 phosphatidate cytidylyltransferase [Uliginosibacterium sp. 31-12]PLK49574.1 phosphatidate cytidylyltransferase [Uliginosibacterium sp. TH139]